MLSHLTPAERFGYLAISVIVLFALGFAGQRYLERPAPVVFQTNTGSPTTDALGSGQEATDRVIVHVVGAVKRPGLLQLKGDVRVGEAIELAGGAVNADLDQLNLAAHVQDGTQIYVPKKGEEATSTGSAAVYQGGSKADSPYAAQGSKPKSSGKAGGSPPPSSISLNTATAGELDRLPGVGPATAAKILEYRRAHGGFTSIDEVLAVKGIGPKKLAEMRKFLRL